MLISDAYAQTAGGAGAGDPMAALLPNLLMFGLIIVIFYFMLIRPQQRRLKAHQAMIGGLKRGDIVVTSGGMIGKVRSVADDEVKLELAPNVEVRVVRSTIAEVRAKTEPAPANDSSAS